VLQEGVDGSLEGYRAAWKSHDFPHGASSLAVAVNAGSSSLPRHRDSPGPAFVDQLSPQQIGCLLRYHQRREEPGTMDAVLLR
jgi:hypothetical protein